MQNYKAYEKLGGWLANSKSALLLVLLVVILVLVEIVPSLQHEFPLSGYLPFHTVVEIMAAIVAGLVFSVGWHSYNRKRPAAVTLLACAFLAVGLLDIGHLISYKGMPDFVTSNSPSKAIYFWMVAKIVLALALVIASVMTWRPFTRSSTRWLYLSASIIIVSTSYFLILFASELLPQVYVPGYGLTKLKIGLEWLVIFLHALAIVYLINNHVLDQEFNTRLLATGVVVLILSEWCFTRYVTVTDTWHVIGHLYKFIGYVYVYYTLFVASIRAPYISLYQSQALAVREKATTEATLNAIGDAVITINLNEKIDFLNPAAKNMLGGLADEAIGSYFTGIVTIVDEKEQDVSSYPITQCLMGQSVLNANSQLLLKRKDGQEIPIDETATPIMNLDGQVTGVVITFKDVGERRRAQKALWQSEHMFHDLLEFAPDAIVISNAHGRISVVNSQAEKLFGYSKAELKGQAIEILIPARLRGDHDRYRKEYHGQPHPRPMGAGMDIFCVRKDGSEFPGDISLGPLETSEGRLVMAVVRDVTERRLLEAQNREAARYARSLIEASLDPLVTISSEGTITDVNHATEVATGVAREQLIGSDFAYYFTEPDMARNGYRQAFLNGMVRDWPLTLESVSGQKLDVLYNASVYADESGKVQGVFAAARDVTERRKFERELSYQATHDALTKLPNRVLFQDRLQQAIAHSRRAERNVAVLFLDLDNFKQVNDTLGHAIGDSLLCEVAERISNVLREGDTVARFGGDEFVILLQEGLAVADLDGITRKILNSIGAPYDIKGNLLYANASMGITIAPLDGDNPEALLRNADTAMYAAKGLGRNTYCFFSSEMDRGVREKLEISNQLRLALVNAEFELYYQPKVSLKTGLVTGVEALIRWHHPQLGMVPPGRFIPVAEEYGLINEIGLWVINEAGRQIREWLDDGVNPGIVAINFSAGQCRTNEIIERVKAMMTQYNLTEGMLEVEITESMMMHDADRAIGMLWELRKMGVHIAMDDFGTGYSSLSYLKRFPINCLKIDKSFIDDIEEDSDGCEIVNAIIAMGHGLGLKIVAEGVETEKQLKFLYENGCDEMQGYLFSKPVPAQQFVDLCKQGRKLAQGYSD